ncbi:hypothetical protein PILCRDRAFT_811932 [Piloderma croceum F 1598]|uniref:Uncharacterized protein n=1 Tax=Piloderma croceum (strain F 1598) TaxID=765440 RepID=A0A0C3G1Q4_PILCF|nr:hypothetical protein PILCRDRAFT_811932 [Piloderma croceum F 1598]
MELSDPPPPPPQSSVADSLSRAPSYRVRPLPQGPRIPAKLPQTQPTLNTVSPNSYSPSTSASPLVSPTPPSITRGISFESAISPNFAKSSSDKFINPPESATKPHLSLDVGIQAEPYSPLTPSSESKLVVKTVPKAATLVPPPRINFDSVPISFKGISLEAAQWTFTSTELQEVVSRAIRLSANESFIRVLSIETLDKGIVDESERLATLKLTTQSQYRFQVHRRTMLLQALNSSATATPCDPNIISNLAVQLSETTAQCDRLMEELLRISDQHSQLAKVQDLHWASALAIALRKINKSYERRTHELREAQDKIEMLEAELEEAWKEAEEVAQEIDNLEAGLSDDECEGEDVTIHTAHVVGIAGKAVATATTLMSPTQTTDSSSPKVVAQERVKTRTARAENNLTRHSSERSTRWSRVAAARTRSRLTSHASLRVMRRSASRAGHGSEDKLRPPPLPIIPGNRQDNSFLDLDGKPLPHTSANPGGSGGFSSSIRDKLEERPHPFSAGVIAEDVPSVWLLADTSPDTHPEERDHVQSMRPFPLIRHDSAGRSSSEYSKLRPRQARHSVPSLPLPPANFGTNSSLRSETP